MKILDLLLSDLRSSSICYRKVKGLGKGVRSLFIVSQFLTQQIDQSESFVSTGNQSEQTLSQMYQAFFSHAQRKSTLLSGMRFNDRHCNLSTLDRKSVHPFCD